MNDLKTAAQQALEALEWIAAQKTGGMIQRKATEPITALKAALSEPQEPVQERCKGDPGECEFNGGCMYACLAEPQEPTGCDHCRHSLYVATQCRVCGRVTA